MLIEDYLIISKSVCAYFRAGKIPTKFCSEVSDYHFPFASSDEAS